MSTWPNQPNPYPKPGQPQKPGPIPTEVPTEPQRPQKDDLLSWTPPPLPPRPHTLAESFARMEGYYVQTQVPNRPQRNKNPGDIEFGSLARQHGAVSGDPRFAIFPTAEQGFACLNELLGSPFYRNLTVEEAINRYAPPNENNTVNYVDLVCLWRGCKPDDMVSNVLAEDPQRA